MSTSKIYTAKEIAEIFSFKMRGVAKLTADGTLPAFRVGGSARYSENALRKVLPRYYVGHSFVQPAHFSDKWLTAAGVGREMQVSAATVLRWFRQRMIPGWRFGQHTLRFRVGEIVACSACGSKRK